MILICLFFAIIMFKHYNVTIIMISYIIRKKGRPLRAAPLKKQQQIE